MPTDTIDILRRIPLFAPLPLDELAVLAWLTRRLRFRTGELLCQRGEIGRELYVLLRGRVRVFTDSPDGNEMVLGHLTAGECVGELSLLDGLPRSANVQAAEAGEALVLSRNDLLTFLRGKPEIAIRLLEVLSRRLRHTNDLVEDAAFLDVAGRLAKRLLEFASSEGSPVVDGVAIAARLTHVELAAMIGASRESVTKALHEFARVGLITSRTGQIVIHDPKALWRRAVAADVA